MMAPEGNIAKLINLSYLQKASNYLNLIFVSNKIITFKQHD